MTERELGLETLGLEMEEAWGHAAPSEAEMDRMYREMGQSTAPDLTDDELATNYVRRTGRVS